MFGALFKKIFNPAVSLVKDTKRKHAIQEIKELFVLNLTNLDRRMTEEITNLAVQSSHIQRKMKALQKSAATTREELIRFDNKIMTYEDEVYRRMEIRHVTQEILSRLNSQDTSCEAFLSIELDKKPTDGWLYYLGSLTLESKTNTLDLDKVSYALSIFEEDMIEFDEQSEELIAQHDNNATQPSNSNDIFHEYR